jgi:hypothetical protein
MTDRLPVALRALWHELPLLAASGVLICTASVAVVAVMPGLGPGGVLLAALLVAPVWSGVVATMDSVVLYDRGGVLRLLRNLKRHCADGLAVGLVPAALVALALTNRLLYSGPLMLLPLGVSCCASVLALLASFSAFSLRVTAGLRGKALWFTALAVVALGILSLVLVALLLGVSVTASLLLLAPGPVALFASAGTWTIYRTEKLHALHR